MRALLLKVWIWFHLKLGLITHEVSLDDGIWGTLVNNVKSEHFFIPVGRFVTLLKTHQFLGKRYWTVRLGNDDIFVPAEGFEKVSTKLKIGYRLWMM